MSTTARFTEPIKIYFSPDQMQQLRQYAEANGESIAAAVRGAVENMLRYRKLSDSVMVDANRLTRHLEKRMGEIFSESQLITHADGTVIGLDIDEPS